MGKESGMAGVGWGGGIELLILCHGCFGLGMMLFLYGFGVMKNKFSSFGVRRKLVFGEMWVWGDVVFGVVS